MSFCLIQDLIKDPCHAPSLPLVAVSLHLFLITLMVLRYSSQVFQPCPSTWACPMLSHFVTRLWVLKMQFHHNSEGCCCQKNLSQMAWTLVTLGEVVVSLLYYKVTHPPPTLLLRSNCTAVAMWGKAPSVNCQNSSVQISFAHIYLLI